MKLLIKVLEDMKKLLNNNPFINLIYGNFKRYKYLINYSYLIKYYIYKYKLQCCLEKEIKNFLNDAIKIYKLMNSILNFINIGFEKLNKINN